VGQEEGRGVFVRLALESDFDAIVDLARQNCEISTPHLTFSAERVLETCRQYIATADPTIFVVDDRREVIGLLLATICNHRQADGHFVTQEVIFVRPDKHGTRAAVLLMKHLVAWAERLGATEICGGNDNDFKSERTARFLEHFGFKRVGFFMRRVL
jgi:L-amino acid N-acyltransferase YncA